MRRGLLILFAALLSGCGGGDDAPEASGGPAVARVGEAVLTEMELQGTMGDATPGLDSMAARRQIIEQWVRREIIVQEAQRAGLDDEPDVQRSLRDSERAVLEAAYLSRFFESAEVEPTQAEIVAYYEANLDRLVLREPYVRVRLLRAPNVDRARQAQNALAQMNGSPLADSLFALTAREYAADSDGAIALADIYLPESRLYAVSETLGQTVATLGAGASPAVVAAPEASGVYAVAVVDRIRTGQTPGLNAIRPEIVETLAIRKRKSAEARHINRLRSEAEAAGRLSTQ